MSQDIIWQFVLFLVSVTGAAAAGGFGAFMAIRVTLAILAEKARQAEESCNMAHRRIDDHLNIFHNHKG